MSRLQVSFRLPAAYRRDDEAGVFVGICPMLNVISQGETREEAARALSSAITLFLVNCAKRGIMDEAMGQLGLVPDWHPSADPSAGEIRVGELPADYSDRTVIEVPFWLIAKEQSESSRSSWPS